MTEVNKFDFSKYDVGGAGATAGDRKLTGEEATKARADGWTIWDGYSQENLEKQGEPNRIAQENEGEGNGKQQISLSDVIGNIKKIRLPKWSIDNLKIKNEDDKNFKIPNEIAEQLKDLDGKDAKEVFDKFKDRVARENGVKVNGRPINDLIEELSGKNDEKLTPEQKEAKTELDNKQSSIGMTYAQARAKVAEVLSQYPNCYDVIEVPYNNEEHANSNGIYTLEYREPEKRKIFNPDKLPEPARTEYKQAMASLTEIENNNSALAKKAGINIKKMENYKEEQDSALDGFKIENGKVVQKQKELTETQKSAREKLDAIVSSTGISYKDAKTTIESITNQYKNNPEYQTDFEQEQSKDGKLIYEMPVKKFDPYKLKGADREVYFKALNAMQEIEKANYALLVEAGLKLTETPQLPKPKYRVL